MDAASKRDVYALAARIFASEIDAELLRRLASAEVAGAGMTLLDDALRDLDEVSALEDLAAEYCRLFVGPRPVCAPYASVQRGEAMLGGRAGTRLLDFLERHGLELTDTGLPIASPDHVAVFLAVLAGLYADAAVATDADAVAVATGAARELLESSVLPWLPAYLERVAENAQREPYASVAKLVAALLEQERDELPPKPR